MRVFKKLILNEEVLEPFSFKHEAGMQGFLIENSEILSLDSEIYTGVDILKSECSIKGGRNSQNTDGRTDLIIKYETNYIGVVELKNQKLNETALTQLKDYLKKKDEIKTKCWNDDEDGGINGWVGVLVGPSICSKLREKIESGNCYENKDNGIPIAAITIQRHKSQSGNVYITTDCAFNITRSANDYTKYKFNEKDYGKGQLVLAVITKYVADNKGKHAADNRKITFSELKDVFTSKFYGKNSKKPMFVSVVDAREVAKTRKRHFINPDQIIELSDGAIAVNSQWGKGNIKSFLEGVKKLKLEKYAITPVDQ